MKKSLPVARFVLTAIFALVIAFATPQSHHRRDFDRAYFAYQRNPTPETEAAFRREYAKNQRILVFIDCAVAMVLFIAINGAWLVAARVWRAARPQAQ